MNIKEVKEFYNFLRGKVPECMTIDCPPKLNESQAFSVIYYLQEHLHLIPDYYEQCNNCKEIYDSREEGVHIEKTCKNYCDDCCPIEYKEGFG